MSNFKREMGTDMYFTITIKHNMTRTIIIYNLYAFNSVKSRNNPGLKISHKVVNLSLILLHFNVFYER